MYFIVVYFIFLSCVNSINWNSLGTKLVTGSDDCDINIWSGAPHFTLLHNLKTAHFRNIFSTQFQPFNEDKIVSCGMFRNKQA
jgi:hypothetical protein